MPMVMIMLMAIVVSRTLEKHTPEKGESKRILELLAIELLYIGNGWDWGNIHFFLVVWGSSWKS